MFSKLFRPSHSMLVAYIALFVALGGTSYAAISITGRQVVDSSLTGKDLKNGSVTTSDIRNYSLRAKDFKLGQLPVAATGAQGIRGFKGETGATGTTGAIGDTGAKGDTGTTGDTGATGDTGLQGDPGADGSNGTPGPQGDPGTDGTNGTNGAPGADGTAVAFAHVSSAGTLDTANSENIVSADVVSPIAGVYCFTVSFTPRNLIATITSGNAISVKASLESIEPSGVCAAGTTAWVETITAVGGPKANGFYVVFN